MVISNCLTVCVCVCVCVCVRARARVREGIQGKNDLFSLLRDFLH